MVKIPDKGSAFIADYDLVDCRYADQKPLRLLQESGAPIIGMCTLCLDCRYAWFVEDDPIKMGKLYKWKLKDD
jgi:hypothetical protein